jgi:hypothetical protein
MIPQQDALKALIERIRRVIDRPRPCSCGDCNACAMDKLLADAFMALQPRQDTQALVGLWREARQSYRRGSVILAHIMDLGSKLADALEALSESPSGVCDECGEPLDPPQATWYHRECDLKRDEVNEEELRQLAKERDTWHRASDIASAAMERALKRAESAEAELKVRERTCSTCRHFRLQHAHAMHPLCQHPDSPILSIGKQRPETFGCLLWEQADQERA